jgi:YegS C-terminal NAD kinase beta sandwich-like domain
VIDKGQPWERPASGPPAWYVEGDDANLAAAIRDQPGARVGFRPSPSSDLARALGIHGAGDGGLELAVDAVRVTADGRELFAVNMVVVGTAPDRIGRFTSSPGLRVTVDGRLVHDGPATTVVIASGQYLRGNDVVPRGHPGDGRAEVQVYAVPRSQRAAVRNRLPQGVHLPHPDITQASGRRVEVVSGSRPAGLEVDGVPVPEASRLALEVVPEAFLIVV